MTRPLVIATVGTQDLQADILGPADGALGAGAKVDAREIAAVLDELDDGALLEVLAKRDVRNGPCFSSIVERHGSADVVLLATDQPVDVADRFRRADTAELARVTARLVALLWPQLNVEVLPFLREPPHDPSDALVREIDSVITEALRRYEPDLVYCLNVGGTPAIRMLVERSVGLRHEGRMVGLVPDADGGVVERRLLALVERDALRDRARTLASLAVRTGRPSGLGTLADTLGSDLPAPSVTRLRELGEVLERLQEGVWPWARAQSAPAAVRDAQRDLEEIHGVDGARFLGRVSGVRAAQADGRLGEAVARWVTISEMLPAIWAGDEGTDRVRCDALAAREACVRTRTDLRPSEPDLHEAAAVVLWCLSDRCGRCPVDPAGYDGARARIARAPRRGRRTAEIIGLRNSWIHNGVAPLPQELSAAVRRAGGAGGTAAREPDDNDLGGLLEHAYENLRGLAVGDGVKGVLAALERAVLAALQEANP